MRPLLQTAGNARLKKLVQWRIQGLLEAHTIGTAVLQANSLGMRERTKDKRVLDSAK